MRKLLLIAALFFAFPAYATDTNLPDLTESSAVDSDDIFLCREDAETDDSKCPGDQIADMVYGETPPGDLMITSNAFTSSGFSGLTVAEYGTVGWRTIKFTFTAVAMPITYTAGAPDATCFGTVDLGTIPAAYYLKNSAYGSFTTITGSAQVTASDTFVWGVGTTTQSSANSGTLLGGEFVPSKSQALTGQTASNSTQPGNALTTAVNGTAGTSHIYLNVAGLSCTATATMTFTGSVWVNLGFAGIP
jgi:hypothetical protein